MRPIFNKKILKKCNLWDREQYIYVLFTIDKVNNCGLKKKKKNVKILHVDLSFIANQTVTEVTLVTGFIFSVLKFHSIFFFPSKYIVIL